MEKRTLLAALALAFLAAAGGAAEPLETRRLRAASEWEAVHDEVVALRPLTQRPSSVSRIDRAADFALRANQTLDGDLHDVILVNGLLGPVRSDITFPASVDAAFVALTAELGAVAGRVLDDFAQEIALYAAANPGKSTAKLGKTLARARDLVSQADAKPTFAQKAAALRKALDLVRRQRVFPHVAKLPKSCFGPGFGLRKGESAQGPWTIFDYETSGLKPIWFEANYGSATLSRTPAGAPGRLTVVVGYCDGRNESIAVVSAIADFPVAGGTTSLGNSLGAHRRGRASGITLTAGSTITITSLNLVDRIVAGTITWAASTGTGNGTCDFVLTIRDP